MDYTKIYQSIDEKILQDLLKTFHKEGVKTARLRPENPTIIEVSREEERDAREQMELYEEMISKGKFRDEGLLGYLVLALFIIVPAAILIPLLIAINNWIH